MEGDSINYDQAKSFCVVHGMGSVSVLAITNASSNTLGSI